MNTISLCISMHFEVNKEREKKDKEKKNGLGQIWPTGHPGQAAI